MYIYINMVKQQLKQILNINTQGDVDVREI